MEGQWSSPNLRDLLWPLRGTVLLESAKSPIRDAAFIHFLKLSMIIYFWTCLYYELFVFSLRAMAVMNNQASDFE